MTKMIFLRGAVPPPQEHPEKLLYESIDDCEDMWTQLFFSLLCKMGAEGELLYQGGNREKRIGSFVERWVPSLSSYRPPFVPNIVICRGGFPYYDPFVSSFPDAIRVYYGAGQRIFPASEFKDYDIFLVDSPAQAKEVRNRTCSAVSLLLKPAASLFRPVGTQKLYDVCFATNSTKNPVKRFESLLRCLKGRGIRVLAIGQIDDSYKGLASQLGLDIDFREWVPRKDLPPLMGQCRIGVCSSGSKDSCPRVVPEFLACDLPVVVPNDLGLWYEKYITPETGVSVGIDRLADGIADVLGRAESFHPRRYYEKELSLEKATEHLAGVIEDWRTHGLG